MKKHEPIYYKQLSPAERTDLASITKHPGMEVLLEKIAGGHFRQQLMQIMDVDVDDPERMTKLAAISSTAYSMQFFLALIKKEVELNWVWLQDEEERLRKGAEKAQ